MQTNDSTLDAQNNTNAQRVAGGGLVCMLFISGLFIFFAYSCYPSS